MKIVVVSPHRDDAAFSLGLAIEVWLAGGHSVEVLDCFTRSVYAPYSDTDSLHTNDRMSYVTALRAREDIAWAKLYHGDLRITDLRLKDAPIRLRCSPRDVLGRSALSTDKALLVIQRGLSRAGADAFMLPLAIGSHVDHATALEGAVPGVSGHIACAFYEDLPYAAWPGGGSDMEHKVVDAASLLGEPLTPLFAGPAMDINTAVARKRQMALCYDSQIDDTVVEQIASFCTRYAGRERLWVNAAWRRALPESEITN